MEMTTWHSESSPELCQLPRRKSSAQQQYDNYLISNAIMFSGTFTARIIESDACCARGLRDIPAQFDTQKNSNQEKELLLRRAF
jgi:hypothetical protein